MKKYEGSIPFTRSIYYQSLTRLRLKSGSITLF